MRANIMIFKYQLLHIENGRDSIGQFLNLYRENMTEYIALADKIRAKSKECKTLLTEKKKTLVIHALKHRDLAKQIAELTEDLEELRSEKAALLQQLQFRENAASDSFRKEINVLEDGLKKLEASESKYAAELDNALKQYAELQEQAAEFDSLELYEARQTVRFEYEQNAMQRVQNAYGDKYNPLMMFDSKRDVANLLHEEAEVRSIRERLRQKGQECSTECKKTTKKREQER